MSSSSTGRSASAWFAGHDSTDDTISCGKRAASDCVVEAELARRASGPWLCTTHVGGGEQPSSAARSSGWSRSSTTLRLLRIQVWNPAAPRLAAPSGGSTATTSAPASASSSVATGPAMPSDRSTMRMPSRMPGVVRAVVCRHRPPVRGQAPKLTEVARRPPARRTSCDARVACAAVTDATRTSTGRSGRRAARATHVGRRAPRRGHRRRRARGLRPARRADRRSRRERRAVRGRGHRQRRGGEERGGGGAGRGVRAADTTRAPVSVVCTDGFLVPQPRAGRARDHGAQGVPRELRPRCARRVPASRCAPARRRCTRPSTRTRPTTSSTAPAQVVERPSVLDPRGPAVPRRPRRLHRVPRRRHRRHRGVVRAAVLRLVTDAATDDVVVLPPVRRLSHEQADAFARQVWASINLVNLEEHILPIRDAQRRDPGEGPRPRRRARATAESTADTWRA